ncbi:MAG: hypothetical protein ABJA98_13820 [Acidobacteriota bacterium]
MNLRQSIAGAIRSGVPQAQTQQFKASDDIQIEQRVRVPDTPIATRPMCLLPQMKDPDHDLRWIDHAVVHVRHLARPESTCPMCFFQLISKARLAVGDAGEREETIFKVTRQNGRVPQVLDRPALGVQQSLDSLDDVIAMGQEEVQEVDVGLKRHLATTRSGRPLFRREERMKRPATAQR